MAALDKILDPHQQATFVPNFEQHHEQREYQRQKVQKSAPHDWSAEKIKSTSNTDAGKMQQFLDTKAQEYYDKLKPLEEKTNESENTTTTTTTSAVQGSVKIILRVKRKREEEPLEELYLMPLPKKQKITNIAQQMEQVKLAQPEQAVEQLQRFKLVKQQLQGVQSPSKASPLKATAKVDKKQEMLQMDNQRIKHARLTRIQKQRDMQILELDMSRNEDDEQARMKTYMQMLQEKMPTSSLSDEEAKYEYDTYYFDDSKPDKIPQLDKQQQQQPVIVEYTSFNTDIQYLDEEYEEKEQNDDSEDSNASDHQGNEYPEEMESDKDNDYDDDFHQDAYGAYHDYTSDEETRFNKHLSDDEDDDEY